MPTRDGSASVARTLSGKRRLHPLAILFPLNSYSRPPLLGRSIRIPRWVGLSILFVVGLIVDYFSDSVSVLDDGGVLVQHDEFTWVHLSVLIVGIGIVAALLLVRWWSFRWWIEDDAIWTSGGIFNEWRRRVTFGHIVTIDRSSTPVRRLFGVSRIAIETTAVDQAAPDVLFGYLSNKNANLLEDLLITKLVFDGEDNEARRFDPLSVDQLGWWDLILAGATTLQIGRALVVLYAAILFFQAQLAPSLVIEFDSTESTVVGLSPALFVIVPILGIIVVLWLVSTVYFVVSFARFRLGKHEGWLILETGVIRRSRRLIKAGAIQGLEISRSPLQRYFRAKRAMLRMRLPAYGSPPIYAMVLHPAVTDATLPSLTSQIAGMDLATSEAMCGKGVHPLAAGSRNAYITYWPKRIAAGLRRVAGVAADPSAAAVVVGAPPLDPGGAVRDLGVARVEECRLVRRERRMAARAARGVHPHVDRREDRSDPVRQLVTRVVLACQRDLLTGHLGCHERRGGPAQPDPRRPPRAGRSLARSHPRRGRDGRRENRDLERIRAIAAQA